MSQPDWKQHGIRIVRAGELDSNTAQTPGMTRAATITHASAGANKLWAGTVVVQPNVVTRDGHAGVQTGELLLVTEHGPQRLHGYPQGLQQPC